MYVSLMNYFAVFFIFLSSACRPNGSSTMITPANIRSVTLYDIDPREVLNYSNRLSTASSYVLKREEIDGLFGNTTTESLHVWKGSMLGIVELDNGEKHDIAISHFGGYARVIKTGVGIRFTGSSAAKWEEIQRVVLREQFIPNRFKSGN